MYVFNKNRGDKLEDKLFKILLDDYSVPSFITSTKNYYGTMDDINDLMRFLEENNFSQQNNLINIFPVKILHEEKQQLEEFEWEHMNIWNCPYNMRLKNAKLQHLWIKDGTRYYRVFKAEINGLCYKVIDDKWIELKGDFWGFPGMIISEGDITYNRLFCIEKSFDSIEELQKDYKDFLCHPDVIFDKFCDDIFGDG